MNKEELHEKLLCFCPSVLFDKMNGRSIYMCVDAFNDHIFWEVSDDNESTYEEFYDFDEAVEYYLRIR